MNFILKAFTAAALSLSLVAISHAQSRPINIVIPFAGGGPSDPVVRPIAQRLQEKLGRPVVVHNKPGANGSIGSQFVAREPADGDTILFHITGFIQYPALSKRDAPYDFANDFQPITLIGRQSVALAVPGTSPVNSVPELIDQARNNRDTFAYGSYGPASTSHIYGETFARMIGVDIPHAAFKGMSPLLIEMLAERIPMAFISIVTAVERIEDKSLKILAVTGTERAGVLPSVPTLKELGYDGFDLTGFFALYVRKGSPEEKIKELQTALGEILQEDEIKTRLSFVGLDHSDETMDSFARSMVEDHAKWKQLGETLNISMD